jgi:hypothetical protein
MNAKRSVVIWFGVVLALALGVTTVMAAGPTGAIFTTTPDGGIVNENVRYNAKIEVYLDGGPGPNAPQTAAGLDDGWYVFQVTDPSGWVLLSMDPAKCRVLEVQDGIITRLVEPSELGLSDGYTDQKGNNIPHCHIQDSPDGVAGPSGRHDTNTDVDHGANGAIVVQLMPFLDTPNPGGVYKAWVTYFDTYEARGGDLTDVPGDKNNEIVKKKGVFQGYENDPGFGPPRSDQKTDNFKVKEVPPYIKVFKYVDTNGNGMYDAGEPAYDGWKITLTETLYDGTQITNVCYTPCERAVAPNSTVTVEEEIKTGWMFTYVYVDGVKPAAQGPSVDVMFAPGDMSHTVKFGNFEKGQVKACKYEDKDGDGGKDAPIAGWKVFLTESGVVVDTQYTGSDGCYTWTNLGPLPTGYYDVEEETRYGWTPTSPTKVEFTPGPPQSGFAYSADFTNFKNVEVKACKLKDRDGYMETNDRTPVEGWKVFLTKNGVIVDTQYTGADGCYTWTNLGPVPGGYYDTEEAMRDGWYVVGAFDNDGVFHPGWTAVDFESPPQSGAKYKAVFVNTPAQGCTPGFWQGGSDGGQAGGQWLWNEVQDPQWKLSGGQGWNPYIWTTPFNSFFNPYPGLTGFDMMSLVGTGGGSLDYQKLARDVVAAYLNASWGMAYAYSPAEVAAIWADAVANNSFLYWHTIVDKANNAPGGCPISASGY